MWKTVRMFKIQSAHKIEEQRIKKSKVIFQNYTAMNQIWWQGRKLRQCWLSLNMRAVALLQKITFTLKSFFAVVVAVVSSSSLSGAAAKFFRSKVVKDKKRSNNERQTAWR